MPDQVIGCIRDLSIGSNQQEDGLQYLRDCPLEWLQPKCCPISSSGKEGLVQAYLPNMQELSFVNVSLKSKSC